MFDSTSFSSVSFDPRSWGGLTEESAQADNIAGVYSTSERNRRHKLDRQKREKWIKRLAENSQKGAIEATKSAINAAYPEIVSESSSVDVKAVREQILQAFPLIAADWTRLMEEIVRQEYEIRRLEDQEFMIVYSLFEM